jgi:hypothetical protein
MWAVLLAAIIGLYLIRRGRSGRPDYYEMFTSNWSSSTELVIVTSHFNEDLTWLTNIGIPIVVCGKEGEADSILKSDPKCKTPNKGHEASSYLNFIINNYDNLPMHVAFIHGHESAWHQKKSIIEELMSKKWLNKSYYSLNGLFVQCSPEDDDHFKRKVYADQSRIWDDIFRPVLKMDQPKKYALDCCAQFIVSRESIKKHSLDSYKHLYDFTINKASSYSSEEKFAGWQMEYIWHVIFGRDPEIFEQFSSRLH